MATATWHGIQGRDGNRDIKNMKEIQVMREQLQHLLLPCKKGCKFDLFTDRPSNPTHYYIYLGVILIDSVPNDKGHFLYKLMCARLALSKFKLGGLAETFGYTEKTISKWARILNTGDSPRIAEAFGFNHRGKITPDIQSYIKRRYLSLLDEGEYAYSRKILAELKEYFDLSVTGSGIRPYLREADQEREAAGEDEGKARGNENDGECEIIESDKYSQDEKFVFVDSKSKNLNVDFQPSKMNATCEKDSIFEPDSRKSSSDFSVSVNDETPAERAADPQNSNRDETLPISGARPPYKERFLHHVGLVPLLPHIDALTSGLDSGAAVCRQILAQFLLGALNLEQGKTISKEILNLFLGKSASYIQGLRDNLRQLSTLDFRLALIARNWEMIKTELTRSNGFYYDPHTKKYTGLKKILMGWCGSLHETAEILISDYIHTLDGHPCFVEHYDNLYDLRMRFFFTVSIFKRIFPESATSCFHWFIDRAIYGVEPLRKIVDSGDSVTTWEKGYKRDKWRNDRHTETLIMRVPKNNSEDLRTYLCNYQNEIWEKDERYKRIIVKVSNPSEVTIEVSILTSNNEYGDDEILTYMLRRWLQENDFAYLIRLYGIDQIDSYKSNEYRKISEPERERDFLTKSRIFKELQKRRSALIRECEKAIANLDKKLDAFDARQKRKRDARLEKDSEMYLRIMRMKEEGVSGKEVEKALRKHGRMCKKTKEMKETAKRRKVELATTLNANISALKERISTVERQLEGTAKEESRLQAVVEEKYHRLDMTSKAVLDSLRIMARNSFYELLRDFRPIYDNYRDDHVVLRALTHAPGKIQAVEGVLVVELFPQGDFPKSTMEDMKMFLSITEKKINRHFEGKAIPVLLKLETSKNR